MQYRFPLFTLAYAVAVTFSLVSASMIYWRRSNPGSSRFSLILLALAIWSITSIFEAGVMDVSGKLSWSKLQYLGIVSVSPLWLHFAAEFSNRERFLKCPYRYAIWLIPVITLILALTNEFHGLLWPSLEIPPESADHVAIYGHGVWWYVHLVFSYFCLLLGTVWIGMQFLKLPKIRRNQTIILFFVLLVGWGSNIIYALGLSPVPGMDITPLSFTFITLVLAWSIFRQRLFYLVPLARSKLVDIMTDDVIVIDPDDIVIDYNPAALEITHYQGPSPLGKSIWDMYQSHLPLIERFRDQPDLQTELEIPGNPPRFLYLKINAIKDQPEIPSGQIITIRDITEKKRMERVEQEQRQLAETLSNTASIINSTLDLDEVLDRILENVEKVVPYKAANICLVDENENIRFVEAKGYELYSSRETILSIQLNLKDVPDMKRMAGSGRPGFTADTQTDPEWIRGLAGSAWIRSYIGAPIINKGKLLGFINLDADMPDFFKEEHLDRLQAFADQAALAIQNAQLFEEMEKLAITDSLTGLYNRRYFFAFAENEVERSKRYEKELSLIMMDIDHFKRVNDQFGHQTGDQLLKRVADLSLENLRKVDVMCRFGGEEFIILLPETSREEAAVAAERICRQVENTSISTEKGNVSVTMSVGVVGMNAHYNTLNDLISAADEALYRAKETGRNRVHVLVD